MNTTQIYLEKRLKVITPEKGKSKSKRLVATILKNIESLGYIFSRRLTNHLSTLKEDQISFFYTSVIPVLKQMRGAHKQFNPMYPNFPQQVMDASDEELYTNAVTHYWSFFLKDLQLVDDTWLPSYEKVERLPLDEKHKLDVIDIGSEEDFNNIFTSLLAANTSISESDKQIVTWFVKTKKDTVVNLLPNKITIKEQLCLIVSLLLEHTNSAGSLSKLIKTPTDVLRIATALSDGDISLATNTKFKSFKRKERRFILNLLEQGRELAEQMLKYKERWLRLGERLHPGEFKVLFSKSFKAFSALRNGDKIETFNSNVEKFVLKNQVIKAVNLLKDRPGEFARRLDHLFRMGKHTSLVLEEFISVAHTVSIPVLLQVYSHFKHRGESSIRTFFPKGNTAKVKVLENKLPVIDKVFCQKVAKAVFKVIANKFSEREDLGSIYLDEKLKNYIVPFSQRSASKALKTIVRGSRIDLDGDYDTIRFFIWWKNIKAAYNDSGFADAGYHSGRVDVDLSAFILRADWSSLAEIAFYNLRAVGAVHSGDITDAPRGACEFIDIPLSEVIKSGGRYIAMTIKCFSQQPYKDLPECFAGWMGRSKPKSGEIFEAKTVKNKIDLTSDTNYCIPLIIDAVERKVIWMDLSLKSNPSWCNTLSANSKSTSLVCKAITELKKPTLYDLFSMHAKGRGTIVKEIKNADTIFSEDKGLTPFHIDDIVTKYL